MLLVTKLRKNNLRYFGHGFKTPEYPTPIVYVPKRIVI